MSKYLSADQVALSFKRLASRRNTGKKHLERTSGLMYFLAFDALCKTSGVDKLDFHPDSTVGKNNRKAIELEFTKLVVLDRKPGRVRHVSELGKIDDDNKEPEKRISSNFLTVPLKKASEKSSAATYPSRPAPLFSMGHIATGMNWGLGYHQDWKANLPKFISEIKEPSPFADLAVFVFRNAPIPNHCSSLVDALKHLVTERFSTEVSQFWNQRIDKEKLFIKSCENVFSQKYQPYGKVSSTSDDRFQKSEKKDLIHYIEVLESVLQANDIEIPYNKIKK